MPSSARTRVTLGLLAVLTAFAAAFTTAAPAQATSAASVTSQCRAHWEGVLADERGLYQARKRNAFVAFRIAVKAAAAAFARTGDQAAYDAQLAAVTAARITVVHEAASELKGARLSLPSNVSACVAAGGPPGSTS